MNLTYRFRHIVPALAALLAPALVALTSVGANAQAAEYSVMPLNGAGSISADGDTQNLWVQSISPNGKWAIYARMPQTDTEDRSYYRVNMITGEATLMGRQTMLADWEPLGLAAAGYNEVQAEGTILDDGTAVGQAENWTLDYDRSFIIPVTGNKAWLSSPLSDVNASGQSANRLVGGGLAPGQAINTTTYAGYRATVWARNGTSWDPTYPLEGTSLALPALSFIDAVSDDGRFLAGLGNVLAGSVNDTHTPTFWTKDTVNGNLTTVPIPTGDLGNLNYATQRADQSAIVINEAGALVLELEDDRRDEDDDGINLYTRLVYFNGTTSTVIPFPPTDGTTRNSMSGERGAVIDGVITIIGQAFLENITTDTRSNWRTFVRVRPPHFALPL
jgi:hypothetical protein